MSTKEPFEIAVPEATLTDLKDRLGRTRFPRDFGNAGWEYGTNLDYLKELVEYWRTKYDWRRHEHEMNTFANYKTTIDGIPIHFIHEPGKGLNPMPLILTHGWPWTFWDLQKVIRPLSDPAAFEAVGILMAQLRGDDRAPVAALGRELFVAEHVLHQFHPEIGSIPVIDSGGGQRRRKAIAGQ